MSLYSLNLSLTPFSLLSTNKTKRLIWQNEEEGIEIPILIFEDHPSIIRTETRGQFHLFESLIREEFQVPLNEQQQQVQEFQSQNNNEREIEFDLMTFFITVGIAYLGFLEDQEVSNSFGFCFLPLPLPNSFSIIKEPLYFLGLVKIYVSRKFELMFNSFFRISILSTRYAARRLIKLLVKDRKPSTMKKVVPYII